MPAAERRDDVADDGNRQVKARRRRRVAGRRDADRPTPAPFRARPRRGRRAMRPLNRTRPKYVSITTPNVVRPTMGRAKVRKRKPNEMKPSAMPASVESSAARGVALRTRSAKGAAASSMMPEQSVATRPACHAMRDGIGGARRRGQRLRRQHDQEDVREERHRVDAVRQGADVGAAGALGQAAGLKRVEEVADENRHRGARQHAAVDELRREARARTGTACR